MGAELDFCTVIEGGGGGGSVGDSNENVGATVPSEPCMSADLEPVDIAEEHVAVVVVDEMAAFDDIPPPLAMGMGEETFISLGLQKILVKFTLGELRLANRGLCMDGSWWC